MKINSSLLAILFASLVLMSLDAAPHRRRSKNDDSKSRFAETIRVLKKVNKKEVEDELDGPRDLSLPQLPEIERKERLLILEELRNRKGPHKKIITRPIKERIEEIEKEAPKTEGETDKPDAKKERKPNPIGTFFKNIFSPPKGEEPGVAKRPAPKKEPVAPKKEPVKPSQPKKEPVEPKNQFSLDKFLKEKFTPPPGTEKKEIVNVKPLKPKAPQPKRVDHDPKNKFLKIIKDTFTPPGPKSPKKEAPKKPAPKKEPVKPVEKKEVAEVKKQPAPKKEAPKKPVNEKKVELVKKETPKPPKKEKVATQKTESKKKRIIESRRKKVESSPIRRLILGKEEKSEREERRKSRGSGKAEPKVEKQAVKKAEKKTANKTKSEKKLIERLSGSK